MGGTYGPIPATQLPGLLPMPFNRTGLSGLYCVGDSCFRVKGSMPLPSVVMPAATELELISV